MVNIYCLVDPRDKKPFYVGATTQLLKNRLYEHITEIRRPQGRYRSIKHNFIAQMINEGFKPTISLLYVATMDSVDFYERFFYTQLTNQGFTLLQLPNAFHYGRKMKSEAIRFQPIRTIMKQRCKD